MIAAQTDEVDRALWTALRTLEERAALAHRLAERARERQHPLVDKAFTDRAMQTERDAEQIRQLLHERSGSSHSLPDEPAGPHGPGVPDVPQAVAELEASPDHTTAASSSMTRITPSISRSTPDSGADPDAALERAPLATGRRHHAGAVFRASVQHVLHGGVQRRPAGRCRARRSTRRWPHRRAAPTDRRRPHSRPGPAVAIEDDDGGPQAGDRIDSRNAFDAFSSKPRLRSSSFIVCSSSLVGLQLLVHRLELLVGRLQLLVGRLELLDGGLQFLVRGLELLVRRLELLVGRLELLLRMQQVVLQRLQIGDVGERSRACRAACRLRRQRSERDVEESLAAGTIPDDARAPGFRAVRSLTRSMHRAQLGRAVGQSRRGAAGRRRRARHRTAAARRR